MQTLKTTLTSKGQVTIPQAIRRRLGLKAHDQVEFEMEGDSARLRRAKSSLLDGFGAVTPVSQPEDFVAVRAAMEAETGRQVVAEAPTSDD